MTSGIRRAAAPLALLAVFVLGACSKDASDQALQQDSALARDLARAGTDSMSQPQLKDVPPPAPEPAAPARRRAPSPAPKQATNPPPATKAAPPPATPPGEATTVTKSAPGSEPALGSIPAGTSLALTSTNKVCTNTSQVGDRFIATVNDGVTGTNGASIPAGTHVTIELTALHGSQNANDQIQMGFRVVSLTIGDKTYTPDADIVTAQIDRVRTTKGSEDAKKVAGGAIAGAIIGQIIGKDRKGTLIGAAAGAAAGGAAAAATGDYAGCVNVGSPLTVKLNTPLTVAAGD